MNVQTKRCMNVTLMLTVRTLKDPMIVTAKMVSTEMEKKCTGIWNVFLISARI